MSQTRSERYRAMVNKRNAIDSTPKVRAIATVNRSNTAQIVVEALAVEQNNLHAVNKEALKKLARRP